MLLDSMIRDGIKIEETCPGTYDFLAGLEGFKPVGYQEATKGKRMGIIVEYPMFDSFAELVKIADQKELIRYMRAPFGTFSIAAAKQAREYDHDRFIGRLIEEAEGTGALDIEFQDDGANNFNHDNDALYFRARNDGIVVGRAYIHNANSSLYELDVTPGDWHALHAIIIRPEPYTARELLALERTEIIEKSA